MGIRLWTPILMLRVTCSKVRIVSMSSLAANMHVLVFGVSPSIDTDPPGTKHKQVGYAGS